MGKTLSNKLLNLAGGAVLSAAVALLFPGCEVDNIPEKTTEAVTGEENAYNEALEIAKNPGKFARESLTEKPIEPEKKDAVVEKVLVKESHPLEDFFLQGKELEGISLIPEAHAGFATLPYEKNPYTEDDRKKIQKIWEDDVKRVGIAYYYIPSDKGYIIPKDFEKIREDVMSGKIKIAQMMITVSRFDSEKFAEEFFDKRQETIYHNKAGGLEKIDLIKGDIWASMELGEVTTKQQAISYIDCLSNYIKRISPKDVSIAHGEEGKEISEKELLSYLKQERNSIDHSFEDY